MKSLLGLSYRARMKGRDFTAEVLQWLITGCRKATLSVLGMELQGHNHQGLQRGFLVLAQGWLSVPSTQSYKGCQELPVSAQQRFRTPYFWTPRGCCLIQCEKRLQQTGALALIIISCLWFMVWRGGNCGLPVSSWSWTGNTQQLSSESTTMASTLTWACEDTVPCAYTPLPASYNPAKRAWMSSLTEKLLWGLV